MSDLRSEIVGIMDDVFTDLTTDGINFAAREPVYREIHGFAAGATAFRRGTHTLLNPADGPLTAVNLRLGQVKQWRDGTLEITGDAQFETPQTLTMAQLQGKGLPSGQEVLYRIGQRTLDEDTGLPAGGELYRIENGGVQDNEGLTWLITLRRAAQ